MRSRAAELLLEADGARQGRARQSVAALARRGLTMRYATRIMSRRTLLIVAILIAMGGTGAQADALDIPFLLHANQPWTLLGMVSTVLFFMLGNLALNFMFLGLPAGLFGRLKWAAVGKGTAGITISGQGADVLARYAATVAAGAAGGLSGFSSSGLRTFFIVNLTLSGVAVAVLVWFWARRYWLLRPSAALALAGVAAVVTNPGWATGYWLAAGWADHVA